MEYPMRRIALLLAILAFSGCKCVSNHLSAGDAVRVEPDDETPIVNSVDSDTEPMLIVPKGTLLRVVSDPAPGSPSGDFRRVRVMYLRGNNSEFVGDIMRHSIVPAIR